MTRRDPLEVRARELAVAAGTDPDSRVAKLGSERGMPAWCGFRDAAHAELMAREIAEAAQQFASQRPGVSAVRWVRRVKPWMGVPVDGLPWVADARTFDIPETIAACIRNAAPGMVAITLSRLGGGEMIRAAERAAAERGVRVVWWTGPRDPTELAGP